MSDARDALMAELEAFGQQNDATIWQRALGQTAPRRRVSGSIAIGGGGDRDSHRLQNQDSGE